VFFYKFLLLLIIKIMTNNITSIIAIILCFIIVAMMGVQCDATPTYISEKFENLFEHNINSVCIEAFGDEGYWDNTANTASQVRSHGPPIGGTQSASYQLYQQAVNAATPTVGQLDRASNLPGGGYGLVGTQDAPGLVPFAGNGSMYDAAAVDFGNRRAEMISPCAQNAPTFVASSLLPKINMPGVPSWSVMDTQALANQDFLSATQQIGVDTVMSSLRNSSYDLRNNIPNPINVVSPWNNTTITPDLQRRPLDGYIPEDGIYGVGYGGASMPTPLNG
jgi:hypothetical protein